MHYNMPRNIKPIPIKPNAVVLASLSSAPMASNKQLSKSARRRRRARRNKANTLQSSAPAARAAGTRTTAKVEKALSRLSLGTKPNLSTNPGASWGTCRLNPWGVKSLTAPRLPDGNSANGYSYDIYSYADINVGTLVANFDITTFPGLPFQAYISSPTGVNPITIVGANATGILAPTTSPGPGFCNYTGQMVPGAVAPICYGKFTVSDTPFNAGPTTYGAAKARIISQAWRLTYTGPANTCQGIVTVNPQSLTLDPPQPLNKQLGRINYSNLAGTAGAFPTDCAVEPILVQSMAFGTATANKDSRQMRPETAPHGVVRRSAASTDWEFKDISEQAFLLVDSSGNSGTLGRSNLQSFFDTSFGSPAPGGSTVTMGAVDMIDDQWDQTIISLTGVTGSFRFETITCFEFLPTPGSIQYDLSTPSPPLQIGALKNVETLANARLAIPTH